MLREQDSRLIRLVASRFGELRGLLTMVGAMVPVYMAMLMMLAARWDAADTDVSEWFFVALLLPAGALLAFHLLWLRPRILAYYDTRFGRVQSPYLFSGQGFLEQAPLAISALANAHLPWLIVLTALVFVAAWPARIVSRDWPYRWYWGSLVVVAVAMAAEMSGMPSYEAALQHIGRWYLAIGASLAFCGWNDHRLLVRALTAARQTDGHQQREGSSA